MNKTTKDKAIEHRNNFFASFFPPNINGYAEVEVNGFYLIRQVSGATDNYVYTIYSRKSYKRYKSYQLSRDV